MLKKFVTIVMAVALPLFAMAQEVKLGYINSQEVLMLMPGLADVEKQLADFNAENTKYLQEMQKEVEAKYAKFEQDKATMSEAIRKVQEAEIQELYGRMQTAQQTLYQEGQAKQQKLIQPLQDSLKTAIENVGKRLNLYFVYDMASGAILYKSDKAVDITPAVKKELGII